MKKKVCVLLLVGTCLFSISACGNKAVSDDTGNVRDCSRIEESLERRDSEESEDNEGESKDSAGESKEHTEEIQDSAGESKDTIEASKDNTGEGGDSTEDEELAAATPTDAETATSAIEEEDASSETAEENKDGDENEQLVDGMRPEFKEAMDSYEAFYDEYCNIMKKYAENPSDLKLLADYTKMLTKVTEMAEKFDAWENSDMNKAELQYYLEVNNRVTQKLLEIAE